MINCRFFIVVSDKTAGSFNRSRATFAIALDRLKAFNRVWRAVLLRKLKFYGISGQVFDLILAFFSNPRVRVVLDGTSLKVYPFTLHFSYYTPMNFLMMLFVIVLSTLMILLSTLSVIWHLIRGNN